MDSSVYSLLQNALEINAFVKRLLNTLAFAADDNIRYLIVWQNEVLFERVNAHELQNFCPVSNSSVIVPTSSSFISAYFTLTLMNS